MTISPDSQQQHSSTDGELCICGHVRSRHADASIGDTRCLAVEDRRDLLEAFDDGRSRDHAYCACLRFSAARVPGGGDVR
jgi:hypothetical protein